MAGGREGIWGISFNETHLDVICVSKNEWKEEDDKDRGTRWMLRFGRSK